MNTSVDGYKVLVADDEIRYCEIFEEYFKPRGYQVDIAENGAAALVLLKRSTYDFIFVDCNMPDLNGIEILRILENMPAQGKRVMISGYDLIDADFAHKLKVDAFFKKPFEFTKIHEFINQRG